MNLATLMKQCEYNKHYESALVIRCEVEGMDLLGLSANLMIKVNQYAQKR